MTYNLTEVSKFLIAGLTLSAVIAAPAACSVHRNMVIAELVKGGAEPMAARCATGPAQADYCMLVAARGAK